MRLIYILVFSLFTFVLTGCSDCESDYDAVGVTVSDFAARTGIEINTNIPEITACETSYGSHTSCVTKTNNPSHEMYGVNQGFTVQCANINSSSYIFDLEQSIQTYFPMESYKEKDDPFEKCYDYWVYDFFAAAHKSERALSIDNVNIDAANPNIWYVSIGGTCYQWNVTNSNYAVVK